MTQQNLKLNAGEWVEVRPLPEILATLDERGCLDELPFMPQMIRCCGKQFQVRKRAHKLCDTAYSTGARSMRNAVFLEMASCDGKAYGGCEMGCQIFWKEAWLKRTEPNALNLPSSAVPLRAERQEQCSEADIWAGTKKSSGGEDVFVCQATQMLAATKPLSRWAPGQYIEDYASGNAPLSQIASGIIYVIYSNLVNSGLGFGSALRWAYDAFQRVRGGCQYPDRFGVLAKGKGTPTAILGLETGELVRVRPFDEILETVDRDLINRGMSFHPEMVPYCNKTFRVRQRVSKIINERNGHLKVLKNPCVILEGADCIGRYTKPLNCPRACYPYWREIWLERVDGDPVPTNAPANQTHSKT